MDRFHIVPDVQAIVMQKGRYRQVDVYRRGDRVYVRIGQTFLRCYANGGTSDPRTMVNDMDTDPRIVFSLGQIYFREIP
jgi:hypothetical protein